MATKAKPAKTRKYELHQAVKAVVDQYESQAEAARQHDIGKTYLSRLMTGVKENPSDGTLSKLGITRHTYYTVE